MLLALIASCSDDDKPAGDKDSIATDTKLIQRVELIDMINGEERAVGKIDFRYDSSDRLVNVKVEESDYVDGRTTLIKETMFSYNGSKITFSTMTEDNLDVSMTRGEFELDKHNKVVKAEITEDDTDPMFFTYKYDGSNLVSSHMRTKGYVSKTTMDWNQGNISMFQWTLENNDTKERRNEYEKVEYYDYYNNASIDIARMICFGSEGSMGVSMMCGSEEGMYLNIAGKRVRNLPSTMTALADGSKVIKDFEYKRDRNNRIYEIKVKKLSIYRNDQKETKEYKYMIGY